MMALSFLMTLGLAVTAIAAWNCADARLWRTPGSASIVSCAWCCRRAGARSVGAAANWTAASMTRLPSGTTSLPIPSPGSQRYGASCAHLRPPRHEVYDGAL